MRLNVAGGISLDQQEKRLRASHAIECCRRQKLGSAGEKAEGITCDWMLQEAEAWISRRKGWGHHMRLNVAGGRSLDQQEKRLRASHAIECCRRQKLGSAGEKAEDITCDWMLQEAEAWISRRKGWVHHMRLDVAGGRSLDQQEKRLRAWMGVSVAVNRKKARISRSKSLEQDLICVTQDSNWFPDSSRASSRARYENGQSRWYQL